MKNNTGIIAVIFDDHKVFSDSFAAMLEGLDIFRSVFSFSDDKELTRFYMDKSNNDHTYLFIDYYLPDTNGLSVIREIRRLNKKVKVIVLTSLTNRFLINDVQQHNPDAFLSKSSGIDEVIEAVKAVGRSEKYLSPFIREIIDSGTSDLSGFTERELELLQYFAKGYSIEATAKALHLSIHTIIAHRKKMMHKANCKSIVELLAHSREAGLI